MKNNSKQRNSIAGALFGVAVGDALGGPVEFMSPEDIIRRHVCVSDMIGGGWLNLAPGEITDDTQMTLCVAEGIVENPTAPIEAIGRLFIQWANSGPKDIGGACRSSISNAKRLGGALRGTSPTAEMWEHAGKLTQDQSGRPVEGNGALMRTVYPGLFYANPIQAELWAWRIGKMTHAGPRSNEACKIYSRMVHLATASESRPQDAQSVRDFLAEHCRAVLAGWEVGDREELLAAVEELLETGNDPDFQAAAREVRYLSDSEIARRANRLGETDRYMWPRTKELWDKWTAKGIRAWDLCRVASFLEWG